MNLHLASKGVFVNRVKHRNSVSRVLSSPLPGRGFRSLRARLIGAIAVIVLISGKVFAYSSYGLGNLSCATYLERRGEDQESHSLENTSYIHAYLSGYLTAGNMMRGLVDEKAEDISINIHRFVQWLDAKCGDRKNTQVAIALEEFWVEAAKAQEVIKRKSSPPQN